MANVAGHEVFNPSTAGEAVQNMLDNLHPSCTGLCKCCGSQLSGLQVFVGDVDQAFESCSGENVGIAWSIIAYQFLAKTGQSIVQIKRGRKFQSKIGSQGWSRGWWALSLQVLGAALQAAAN